MTVQPWMIEELIFIPKIMSGLAIIILLLAGIKEYRQGHIGRVGIATNVFLLWQIFYEDWANLPNWLQWYLNIGTIFALIAIPSYLFKFSLPTEYYQMAFIGYCSFSIIVIVYFYFFMNIDLIKF